MLGRLLWILSIGLFLILSFVVWFVLTNPNANAIKGCMRTKLFEVWLCEDSKNYVPLSQISTYMKNLVLISEDAGFYGHSGFDWDELKNSIEIDASHGRAVRGGSTITQQLAKNIFLTNEKTIIRKLREALLTVQIETLLTKNKILEKYLNVIELGPGIYGVGPAAQYYFHKPASDLNLLEAAYLTFLIPNPKEYSRSFNKSQLTKYGRYRVLDLCFRLMQTKRIVLEQYLAARKAIDMFPWQALPENFIAALAGAVAPQDIRDVIDPSTFDTPAAGVKPEAQVQPDAANDGSAYAPVDSPAPATTQNDTWDEKSVKPAAILQSPSPEPTDDDD